MLKPFTTYVETGEKKRVFVIIDIDYVMMDDGKTVHLDEAPKTVWLMEVWTDIKQRMSGAEFMRFLEKGLLKKATTQQ